MKKAYFKYILSVVLFGMNGIIASRIALSSYEIVFFRTMIGSLFLVALFLVTGGRFTLKENRHKLKYIAVSGVAMGASWMFLYEAFNRLGVGVASLVYYTGPVIVMALSPLVFGEKLTAIKLIGFGAVLAGIVLVNGTPNGGIGADLWGMVCGALSACTYAVMVIFNKKAKYQNGMENSALQLLVSFAALSVFMAVRGGFPIAVAPGDIVWVLMLGLVNTGFGCYLYFSSIGSLPVQSVAVCGYIEPLCAVALSALLLGERMSAVQFCGAALIIGGAVFAETAGLKKAAGDAAA